MTPIVLFCIGITGCSDQTPKQEAPKKVGVHLMIHIPAQTVQVGRDGSVPYDEQPEWYETLKAFYITQTEITNAEFVRFLNEADLNPRQVIQLVGYKGNSLRPSQIVYTGKRLGRLWVGRSFLLQR